MYTTKDKQFITFHLDDGKTVKYDLSTGQTIGKKGKFVKSLNSQLKGYDIVDIIESFENPSYRRFFKTVYNQVNNGTINNMGTLLKHAAEYKNAEQYFTAGINVSLRIYIPISQIPKGLIKICQSTGITLDQCLIDAYQTFSNEMTWAYAQSFNFLNGEHLKKIFTYNAFSYDYENHRYIDDYYLKLLQKMGYDYKALIKYIDNLAAFEAQENISECIREIYDYANMMQKLSHKFEKYPHNFLTTHAIASRNYNRLKEKFDEDAFHKHYIPEYNCTFDNYVFIYPQTTQDIKDEAVQQQNCVASYIQKVIDGSCHIIFLRHKLNPENSLVTIEVKNNKIVQAKGAYNRPVTSHEQEAIDKFNKKFENKGVAVA